MEKWKKKRSHFLARADACGTSELSRKKWADDAHVVPIAFLAAASSFLLLLLLLWIPTKYSQTTTTGARDGCW